MEDDLRQRRPADDGIEAALPGLPPGVLLRWTQLLDEMWARPRGTAEVEGEPEARGVADAIARQADEAARSGLPSLRPRLTTDRSAAAAAAKAISAALAGGLDDPDLRPRIEELEEVSWTVLLALKRAARGLAEIPQPESDRGTTGVAADATGRLRVMVADDDPRLRRATVAALEGEGLAVVGEARDAEEAIRIAAAGQPDVALVDVRMPAGGGPAAARGIAVLSPSTSVLAHSAADHREGVLRMLQAGASGYLLKGMTPEELVDAVRRAARGEHIVSPAMAGHVIDELARRVRTEAQAEGARDRRSRAIRRCLAGRGFRMVGQPIYDLETGDPVGVEALARFAVSAEGPDVWFREAWELGLGAELEVAALRQAIAAFRHLPGDLFLAVNLSPETLLSEPFRRAADGLPWERVVLEMTEHLPIPDYDLFRGPIDEVRQRGGRIAVDDAGAGFASFRHVIELSPDLIKLDRRLTASITEDQRRRALARAVAAFAEEIGSEVVAEGIEAPDAIETLLGFGVAYGQGFHLARPTPEALAVRVPDARSRRGA